MRLIFFSMTRRVTSTLHKLLFFFKELYYIGFQTVFEKFHMKKKTVPAGNPTTFC